MSGWYEYGYRWYDAAIGRFTGVDPIADQFAWVSVFNYAENEPVGHIDLWGLQKYFAPTGEFIWKRGNNETIRVMKFGSNKDCQHMTCGELQNNSIPVLFSTQRNKEAVLKNWASKYQRLSSRYSNDPLGDREFGMTLYTGKVTDEKGNTHQVFVEGKLIEGVKGINNITLSKSESPIEGWKASESIHSHRYGNDSGEFSDDPGLGDKYFQGDIQTSLKTGNTIYLVVPYNNYIGSFNPQTYKKSYQTKSHENAVKDAINKRAIQIN